MAWQRDRQLVASLARRAVSRAAPDELAQFDVTAEAFLDVPKRARKTARRDEPLGLGLDSVTVLVSTVALTVTIDVLKHLAEYYSDKVADKVGRSVLGLFGRRRDHSSGRRRPVLSPEQLSELHALAVSRAVALQVPAEQAALIADGIVAGLALPDRVPAADD